MTSFTHRLVQETLAVYNIELLQLFLGIHTVNYINCSKRIVQVVSINTFVY